MTNPKVKVAILEDHQSIIDGYLYRLNGEPRIEVVATAYYGEEMEQILESQPVDVLLLDIEVPASAANKNTFPIAHFLSEFVPKLPNLDILVISMHTQGILINSLVDAGVNGYIFKDDHESIQQLARIILAIAKGGIYFSDGAYQKLRELTTNTGPLLSPRQVEVLALCVAYPNLSTAELAVKLGIASSTLRNLLSSAYLRLNVRTRAAAIAKTHELGLFPNHGINITKAGKD